MNEGPRESDRPPFGSPESDRNSPRPSGQHVQFREPSPQFRESVQRNLRMGRASATATKKK